MYLLASFLEGGGEQALVLTQLDHELSAIPGSPLQCAHLSHIPDERQFLKGPAQPVYCRENQSLTWVGAAPLVANGGVAVRLAVTSRWRQGNILKFLVSAWQP